MRKGQSVSRIKLVKDTTASRTAYQLARRNNTFERCISVFDHLKDDDDEAVVVTVVVIVSQ
jgi:hypothetical protein